MTDKATRFQNIDGVGLITLDRPEKRNAITSQDGAEWASIINYAKDDPNVKVLVVTGTETSFCAGSDFSREMQDESMKTFPYPLTEHINFWEKTAHHLIRAVDNFDKPYICALNGTATGYGMDLASMCDIRIASDKAKIAMKYVNIGLAPGGGGCYYLPKIIGMQRALDLIWTGRWVDAEEMLKIGYVLKVVPHGQLMEEVMDFAGKIAAGPSIANMFAKKLVRDSVDLSLDQHLEFTALMKLVNWSTRDAKEGISAFLEKRKPVFKGQ